MGARNRSSSIVASSKHAKNTSKHTKQSKPHPSKLSRSVDHTLNAVSATNNKTTYKKQKLNHKLNDTQSKLNKVSDNKHKHKPAGSSDTSLLNVDFSELLVDDDRIDYALNDNNGGENQQEDNDNLLADTEYEQRSNHVEYKSRQFHIPELSTRLPHKTEFGDWIVPKQPLQKPVATTQHDDSDSNDNNSIYDSDSNESNITGNDNDYSELSAAELVAQSHRHNEQRKSTIAQLCNTILSNPEQHIHKVSQLIDICSNDDSLDIRQLCMLSVVELFRDLIPSYRVRLHSPAELAAASKEIKSLWRYETSLLTQYAKYIKLLMELIKQNIHHHRINNIAYTTTVVRCMCRIIEFSYHFNYRKDLLYSVIPLLNNHSTSITAIVSDSLKVMIERDTKNSGDATLDVVKIINQIVKKPKSSVRLAMIDILSHIPLRDKVLTYQSDDSNKSGKPVKRKYETAVVIDERELQHDIAEGNATVDIKQKQKYQISILSELMTIYFRVLKNQQQHHKLLPPVLKGLSRYAYLINIDLVLDLLECLKDIIQQATDQYSTGDNTHISTTTTALHTLDTQSILYCINTAFSVLQGHTGLVLTIDLHSFYTHTYNLLWRFTDSASNTISPLLLQVLQQLFMNTKQLNSSRLIAFMKRLSIISLYVQPHTTIAIVHFMRLMCSRYPSIKSLLDNDTDVASAVYLPYNTQPDYSNAQSCVWWDLLLHTQSYHSMLQQYTSELLHDTPISIDKVRVQAADIYTEFDCSTGGFNPSITPPTHKHIDMDKLSNTALKKVKSQQRIQNRILLQKIQSHSHSQFIQHITHIAQQN